MVNTKQFIIDWEQYQIGTASTAIYPTGENFPGVYPLLGAMGELEEFIQSSQHMFDEGSIIELLKEGGDVFWYVAQCFSDLSIKPLSEEDFEIEYHHFDNGLILEGEEINFSETIKKYYRDSNEDKLLLIRKELVRTLLYVIQQCEDYIGASPKQIMDANLAKLKDRATRGVIQGDGNNR